MAAARKLQTPQNVHVFNVTFIPTVATTVAVVAETAQEAETQIRKSLFKPSTANSPANPGWHSMQYVKSAKIANQFEVDKTPKNPFAFDDREAKLKHYLPQNWQKHVVNIYGSAPKKGGDALYIALDNSKDRSVEIYSGSRDHFFVELIEQAHYLLEN